MKRVREVKERTADMTEDPRPEEDLIKEFRRLGENLKGAVQSAWESEERKNLSKEIHSGLNAFAEEMEKAVNDVVESPSGQRVREGLDDISEKVRSGTLAAEVREELLGLLRKINLDLEERVEGRTTSKEGTSPADEE
jgi:hypothetical protein